MRGGRDLLLQFRLAPLQARLHLALAMEDVPAVALRAH
jgi:hypothetical protein